MASRRFDLNGRLGYLRLSSTAFYAELADAVTKASIDISATQTTQLTLDLIESADFSVLRRGLFNVGTKTAPGTRMDFGDLRLEVRAIELKELGDKHALTVTARTYGVYQMKRARGKLLRKSLSPTTFVGADAKLAGLTFVGQPSPKRPSILRGADESSWDVGQRLASELGYLCWEVAGILYFGQPTWFVQYQPRLAVPWKGASTDPALLRLPNVRRSGDDDVKTATVDIALTWDAGSGVRPGMALDLHGIPTYDGRYMVDSVRIDLGEDQPVAISASTPNNPVPQPPESKSEGSTTYTGSASRPKAGRYGGHAFTATQLGNALTVYNVAQKRGYGDAGAIIAIMVCCVEADLKNLSYGDRDSLGIFQQRAPWGSAKSRKNVAESAGRFFTHLGRVKGWKSMSKGKAAQKVQVSAFPGRYSKWQPEATAIVAAINATRKKVTAGSSGSGSGSGSDGTGGGKTRKVTSYGKQYTVTIPSGPAGVAVNFALNQLGEKYVWGAHGPNQWDCSGLTAGAWKAAGRHITPQSSAQNRQLKHVSLANARPGDIFWHPGHVQLYIGRIGGRRAVVEAPNPRKRVRIDTSGWMHPQSVLRP